MSRVRSRRSSCGSIDGRLSLFPLRLASDSRHIALFCPTCHCTGTVKYTTCIALTPKPRSLTSEWNVWRWKSESAYIRGYRMGMAHTVICRRPQPLTLCATAPFLSHQILAPKRFSAPRLELGSCAQVTIKSQKETAARDPGAYDARQTDGSLASETKSPRLQGNGKAYSTCPTIRLRGIRCHVFGAGFEHCVGSRSYRRVSLVTAAGSAPPCGQAPLSAQTRYSSDRYQAPESLISIEASKPAGQFPGRESMHRVAVRSERRRFSTSWVTRRSGDPAEVSRDGSCELVPTHYNSCRPRNRTHHLPHRLLRLSLPLWSRQRCPPATMRTLSRRHMLWS